MKRLLFSFYFLTLLYRNVLLLEVLGAPVPISETKQLTARMAIAFDKTRNEIFIADSSNHVIHKIDSTAVSSSTLVAGISSQSGFVNGNCSIARFNVPRGIIYRDASLSNNAILYVADSGNDCIRLIQISLTSSQQCSVRTFMGHCIYRANEEYTPSSVDGNLTISRLNSPYGLTINDTSGDLIISESTGALIRRVTISGDISTIAGGRRGDMKENSRGTYPMTGYQDGMGTFALFARPTAMTYNSNDLSIYVIDEQMHTIRRLDKYLMVTTLAGYRGEIGLVDGLGSLARFSFPIDICYSKADDCLFVVDAGYSVIRRVSSGGLVSTVINYSDERLQAGLHSDSNPTLQAIYIGNDSTLSIIYSNTEIQSHDPISISTQFHDHLSISTQFDDQALLTSSNHIENNRLIIPEPYLRISLAKSAFSLPKFKTDVLRISSSLIKSMKLSGNDTFVIGSKAVSNLIHRLETIIEPSDTKSGYDNLNSSPFAPMAYYETGIIVSLMSGKLNYYRDTPGVGTHSAFNGVLGIALDRSDKFAFLTSLDGKSIRKLHIADTSVGFDITGIAL